MLKKQSVNLPYRLVVSELISSRYDSQYQEGSIKKGARPASWDERLEGLDVVKDSEGNSYQLWSSGGQSPPKIGWDIILTEQKEEMYSWTLYGYAEPQ